MIDLVVLLLDWHDKTQPNKNQQPPQKTTNNQTQQTPNSQSKKITVKRETWYVAPALMLPSSAKVAIDALNRCEWGITIAQEAIQATG